MIVTAKQPRFNVQGLLSKVHCLRVHSPRFTVQEQAVQAEDSMKYVHFGSGMHMSSTCGRI